MTPTLGGPHDPLYADVRARLAVLRARSGAPVPPDVAASARNVVILGSSSRGGSSIFAELLRQSPHLLHFRGETNPFLRLHGADGPQPGSGVADSDALSDDDPVPAALGADLGWDCGRPTRTLRPGDDEWRFACEIAARLTLQWPLLAVDLDHVAAAVGEVLRRLRASEAWPADGFLDAQAFHARLLGLLRRRWPEIHPAAYDIDRRLILAHCPGPWPDPFIPGPLVEEPPFVLVTPWSVATAEEVASLPIVLKTPSNAYRIGWFQRLFTHARVRLLHLTRSVAGSVNGLYDGWRYAGFHSHRLPEDAGPLAIAGYSDVAPGGDRWWKFDRPPGWQAHVCSPLEHVCAFQWRSAHAALLAAPIGKENAADRLRLHFEDLVGEPERQRRSLAQLGAWLDVPVTELGNVLDAGLPLVMATERPRARRWFDRIDLLAPLLADPVHRHLMEALGYDPDPNTWG